MCNKCILKECNSLADYIFTIKDNLTDEQFKYLLDKSKRIFDLTNEQKDVFVEAFQPEREEEHECQCVLENARTYMCASEGKLRDCRITEFYTNDIPYIKHIIDLVENKVPVIDTTFTLQTTPIFTQDYEGNKKIVADAIQFLLRLQDYFNTNPRANTTYIVFTPLVVFDYLFRNFNIINPAGRLKEVMIEKLDVFLSSEHEHRLNRTQTLIPHINIRETLNKWKTALLTVSAEH